MYKWLRFLNLPVEFGCIVVIFALVGYKLDQFLQTQPVGVLLGAFLGFAGGLYYLYKEISLFQRKDKRK